jgi:hypothetical protein
MNIPLRIVDGSRDGDREPGAMWRYPDGDLPGRECWWIALPNTLPDPGGYMEISWRTTDRSHERWLYDHHQVTGKSD